MEKTVDNTIETTLEALTPDVCRSIAHSMELRVSPQRAHAINANSAYDWLRMVKEYQDKAKAFKAFRERGLVWSTIGHVAILQQLVEDALKLPVPKTKKTLDRSFTSEYLAELQ